MLFESHCYLRHFYIPNTHKKNTLGSVVHTCVVYKSLSLFAPSCMALPMFKVKLLDDVAIAVKLYYSTINVGNEDKPNLNGFFFFTIMSHNVYILVPHNCLEFFLN